MTTQGECKCGRNAKLVDGLCARCRTPSYDDLVKTYEESLAQNPPTQAELIGTIHSGKCLCCGDINSNLIYGACKECRDVLGQRIGKIARQIRANSALAQKIIDAFEEDQKEQFIRIFGIPKTMWM